MSYARIHDIEVGDTEKLRFSDVRKTMQMSDGVKRVTDIVRAPVVNFNEEDNETFEQIVEMLGTKSFSPILIQDDYSVMVYGDPVNFRHTLGGKDGNLRKFSITVQNHYWRLMMDWTSIEFNTHWDSLFDLDFTTGTDQITAEGTSDVVDTARFFAQSGGWVFAASPDHYYCNGDSGWNQLLVIGSDTSLYPPISDAKVTITINFTSGASGEWGIAIRHVMDNSDNGYGYSFTADIATDEYYFHRHDGATRTLLETWSAGFDLLHTGVYDLEVVCRGGRFDCYAENDEGYMVFVGTAYDDNYVSGYFGFSAETTLQGYFEDFNMEVTKSVVLQLPTDAYDMDQIVMSSNSRLNDNETSDGTNKMIVAPFQPVLFRQDVAALGDPSGGEVKVFDSMGENGLLDYLEFHANLNEGTGTDVNDSSPHDRTVTEYNITGTEWTTSYTTGAKTALDMSASNVRFEVAMDGEDLDDHGWTIGGWFKRDSYGTGHGIWHLYDSATLTMDMTIDSADRVQLTIYGTGGNGIWRTASDTFESTEWYFIVITWTGVLTDDPIIYANGEVMAWATTGTITGDVYDVDKAVFGTNSVIDFDGDLDDVFIYSTVLDSARIGYLYENMPTLIYEDSWRRVFALDHKFVGDIIISNGLIRLKYEKDTTQIITGVYSNTTWEEIDFLPDWSSLTLENIKAQITELMRYSVTLREACYYETTTGFDMVWTDYTIRTGSPMMHIENRRAL